MLYRKMITFVLWYWSKTRKRVLWVGCSAKMQTWFTCLTSRPRAWLLLLKYLTSLEGWGFLTTWPFKVLEMTTVFRIQIKRYAILYVNCCRMYLKKKSYQNTVTDLCGYKIWCIICDNLFLVCVKVFISVIKDRHEPVLKNCNSKYLDKCYNI